MRQFVILNLLPAFLFLFGKRAMAANQSPASSSELQAALDAAVAGDTITLQPIDYPGNFFMSKSGSAGSLIQLTGTSDQYKHTTIVSSGGVGFDLKSSFWQITDLEIRGADLAVNVEGENNVLRSLAVNGVSKGFVIKGGHNLVESLSLTSSGLGVSVVSGDENTLKDSAISSAEFASGTCCGKLDSCRFQGSLSVKGNGYTITSCKGNQGLAVDGCDNTLSSNVFHSGQISSCNKQDEDNVFE